MGGQSSSPRDRHQRRRQSSRAAAAGYRQTPSNVVPFPPPPQEGAEAGSDDAPQLHGFEFFLVWLLRLLILGVGLGAIIGTALAAIWPQRYLETHSATETRAVEPAAPAAPAVPVTRAIADLQAQFVALAEGEPQLTPRAYCIDLDTGEYAGLRADAPVAAASTIKLPIVVALFAAIDAGEVSLDENLVLRPDLIAGGSGTLQYQQPNGEYAVSEVAEKTIVISDNTATNMLVDRLGGAAALNAQFRAWGLEHTAIRNLLPDLAGTNTTSPQELVKLMAMVERGHLVSSRSRDRILAMMSRTQTPALLRQGLGAGATIANKTGNIGAMVGDVGLIDTPSGRRYLAAVMVERPHNDRAAQALIRAYSQATYRHFEERAAATPDFIEEPAL